MLLLEVQVGVTVVGGNIGPMPALKALWAPVWLKMRKYAQKAPKVEAAVVQQLSLPDSARELDPFLEWERVKRIALNCARAVLGTSGGRLSRIIPHRLQEERRLKARLTLCGWCGENYMRPRTAWW